MERLEMFGLGVLAGLALGMWIMISVDRYHPRPPHKKVSYVVVGCGANGLVVDWRPELGICI